MARLTVVASRASPRELNSRRLTLSDFCVLALSSHAKTILFSSTRPDWLLSELLHARRTNARPPHLHLCRPVFTLASFAGVPAVTPVTRHPPGNSSRGVVFVEVESPMENNTPRIQGHLVPGYRILLEGAGDLVSWL